MPGDGTAPLTLYRQDQVTCASVRQHEWELSVAQEAQLLLLSCTTP